MRGINENEKGHGRRRTIGSKRVEGMEDHELFRWITQEQRLPYPLLS
jgi:hypothetical protein